MFGKSSGDTPDFFHFSIRIEIFRGRENGKMDTSISFALFFYLNSLLLKKNILGSFDWKRMKPFIFIILNRFVFSFSYKTTRFSRKKASKRVWANFWKIAMKKRHRDSLYVKTRVLLKRQKNGKCHLTHFDFNNHAYKFYLFS